MYLYSASFRTPRHIISISKLPPRSRSFVLERILLVQDTQIDPIYSYRVLPIAFTSSIVYMYLDGIYVFTSVVNRLSGFHLNSIRNILHIGLVHTYYAINMSRSEGP